MVFWQRIVVAPATRRGNLVVQPGDRCCEPARYHVCTTTMQPMVRDSHTGRRCRGEAELDRVHVRAHDMHTYTRTHAHTYVPEP